MMPSSAEAVCANSAPVEFQLELPGLWIRDSLIPDALEISETAHIRFRAVVWGVSLSALLWTSAFFAGRALWMLWR